MVCGFAVNLLCYLPKALPGFPLLHFYGLALSSIAFTWYVLIGSATTFGVGALVSMLRRRSFAAPVLTGALCACLLQHTVTAQQSLPSPTTDFSGVDRTLADAVAQNQLPGAVVLIGHNGSIAYTRAYGSRALEPQVEPMTTDTIFDMASLSKCLSTATAVMQMYERGKLQFDDPVAKYLPAFSANGKGSITIRQLLTHYSGLKEDVPLTDVWQGKQEGVRRAMESVPYGPPGVTFRYSDINYITLGALVESISGQLLNTYAAEHIFKPLHMTHTTYLPSLTLSRNIAPTAHNDDLPMTHDELLRGVVHDPTTRRMGGVAGHAGVFSTAQDMALYAQALLDRLAGRPSTFPLRTETLRLMCEPEQPSRGKYLRGFGWDIDSPYSRPRGTVFPVGSFGHTGFTGTSVLIDPRSDTYVILLSNAIHPRGRPAISALRGKVATAAAQALQLYDPSCVDATSCKPTGAPVLPGVDVLQQTDFAAIRRLQQQVGHPVRLGLLTNSTGVTLAGKRTIDLLATALPQAVPGARLTILFSPEHGIAGVEDKVGIGNATDAATRLPIVSLYGTKPEDRRPKLADLEKLDAVLVDLQDAGVRFYTYQSVVGYFLEAAVKASNHPAIVVLDRPALISGVVSNGPLNDPGTERYVAYMQEPTQQGLTLGEFARLVNAEKHLGTDLIVVPMQDYQRGLWYDQTGIPWVNPSPNLRTQQAATLYPGLAFLEFTNVSVGRGTGAPFEQIGASWVASETEAQRLADRLIARKLSGVEVHTTIFTPAKPYPFAGQAVHGLRFTVTDRERFDAAEFGLELLAALHAQYPSQFDLAKAQGILLNGATVAAIPAGTDPHDIESAWEPALMDFRERRAKVLLYGYLPPNARVP